MQLKFMYVAVTRARKNLWIADCSEKGEPLRVGDSCFSEIPANVIYRHSGQRLILSRTAAQLMKSPVWL